MPPEETNMTIENKTRIDSIEKLVTKMDQILEKVRNRPPVWVTFAFTGMTLVVGWLVRGQFLS